MELAGRPTLIASGNRHFVYYPLFRERRMGNTTGVAVEAHMAGQNGSTFGIVDQGDIKFKEVRNGGMLDAIV